MFKPLKNTMLVRYISVVIFLLFLLASCDGGYSISGTVYENKNNIKIPVDSVTIKAYVDKDWLRGQTLSDSAGHYHMAGLTDPGISPYYLVFKKNGFITDSIFKQGNRGFTTISYDHLMIRR